MSISANDERFMARALELARQGIGMASPNPHVGAVVVAAGEIVGEGTHIYSDRKHAEVLALEQAGEHARGATLYLNLEPCCHVGRTGPCVDALIAAGVRRVVASMSDPNPLVSGKGFERLRAAGIEVTTGIGEQEARKLNEAFACWIRTHRPLVTLKSAMTLDGKIAPRPVSSEANAEAAAGKDRGWITGTAARAHVHEVRHQSDAILVGIGTVIADNPLLTDRSGKPRRRPLLRVVLDSKLRLPLDSQLVQSAREDVLVFCGPAEAARRAELERRGVRGEQVSQSDAAGWPDLRAVLDRLGAMEITSVLIEGGSRVNGAALAEAVVDKVLLYYAPKILGPGAVPFASGIGFDRMGGVLHARCVTWQRLGEDFAIEGYLHDPYGIS
jgi:diaminohydroxyphosphoribosylaminopyrimidine deaminase/5-amino-6-(5-phosphoribosylamino)uracil reductase